MPRESPTFGGSRAALGCVRPVPASAPTQPSLPASVPAPLTPGHRPRGPVLPALGPTGLVVRFVTHHARGDAAPPRLRFRETRVDGGHPSTGPGVPEVGCVVGETEAGVCIFSGSSVGSDDCGLPASPLCEVQCPPAGGSQRSRLRAGDARGQEPKQLSGLSLVIRARCPGRPAPLTEALSFTERTPRRPRVESCWGDQPLPPEGGLGDS